MRAGTRRSDPLDTPLTLPPRYLIVLYYQPQKMAAKAADSNAAKAAELEALKRRMAAGV